MGVNVAMGCEGVTVHTMHLVNQRGPVFYASMPCADQTLKGNGTGRTGVKHRLVSILWDHCAAMESPLWKQCQSSDRAAFPLQVGCGPLGKPYLLVGEYQGPAISFSEGGGKLWAALSGDGSDIGIDAAGTDEFQRDYPFHRIFQPEELHHAVRLADGDLAEASALLWSVKEAVVKALGCAFHLVDPRHITVYPSVGRDGGGYTFPVGLSGKALVRFPLAAGRTPWVRSLPQRKLWLSIAYWNRRPAGHE